MWCVCEEKPPPTIGWRWMSVEQKLPFYPDSPPLLVSPVLPLLLFSSAARLSALLSSPSLYSSVSFTQPGFGSPLLCPECPPLPCDLARVAFRPNLGHVLRAALSRRRRAGEHLQTRHSNAPWRTPKTQQVEVISVLFDRRDIRCHAERKSRRVFY